MKFKKQYIKYLNKSILKGGDLICNLELSKNTFIYYIHDNALGSTDVTNDTDKNFNFEEYSLENLTYELFSSILNNCVNNNILIFIDSTNDGTYSIKNINKFIENFIQTEVTKLYNISIINFTNSVNSLLYNQKYGNSNVFKKIINIFPIHDQIEICDEINMFESSVIYNKNMYTILDITQDYNSCTKHIISYPSSNPITIPKKIRYIKSNTLQITQPIMPLTITPPTITSPQTQPIRVRPPTITPPPQTQPIRVRPPTITPPQTQPFRVRPSPITPPQTQPFRVRPSPITPPTITPSTITYPQDNKSISPLSVKELLKKYQTKSQYGGILKSNEREVIYRLMNINETNKLTDLWWFKWYFNVPLCAFGRLTQSTGTCWCNTILNILTLTQNIKNLLITKWNLLDDEKKTEISTKFTTLSDLNENSSIFEESSTLNTLLYAMINILLNNKDKATYESGNFVAEFAARIKGIYDKQNEFYYKNDSLGIKYGDGGDSYKGILVILNLILTNNIDYVTIDKYGDDYRHKFEESKKYQQQITDEINEFKNELNIIRESSTKITNDNDELINKFNIIQNTTNDNNELKLINVMLKENNNIINNNIIENNRLVDLINSENSKINEKFENIEKISKNIDDFISNLTIPSKLELLLYDKLITNPKYIIININKLMILPENIMLDEIQYNLHSAAISLKTDREGHAIAGLKCNGQYYIYDSNNYISYTNWHQNKFDDYLELLRSEKNPYGHIHNMIIDFAIYINEN